MPRFLPQQPETSPAYWGTPLIRKVAPNILKPQVGFELQGLKAIVDNVCSSHSVAGHRCTIGMFLYFYDDNRQPLNLIKNIAIKKLDVVFDPASNASNEHWLTRLASDNKATLELDDIHKYDDKKKTGITAKAHRFFHLSTPRNPSPLPKSYSSPTTAPGLTPYLHLENADGYGINTIKGYTDNIRIVYLNYGLLLHMHLSYRNTDENVLKFIFTGAEINHGEIVRPFFQAERCRDWSGDLDDLDPSVTPTLKVEAIRVPAQDQIRTPPSERTDYEPSITGGTGAGIALPTVHVLPPCPRYWQAIGTILSDASSQIRTNDSGSFTTQQNGLGALSDILTKNDLSTILGNVIF